MEGSTPSGVIVIIDACVINTGVHFTVEARGTEGNKSVAPRGRGRDRDGSTLQATSY